MPKTIRTTNLTEKRSLLLTAQQAEQIKLLAAKKRTRTREQVSEADIIREAINAYIAQQDDVAGSRAYYTKSIRERLDALEQAANQREAAFEARITEKLWVVVQEIRGR